MSTPHRSFILITIILIFKLFNANAQTIIYPQKCSENELLAAKEIRRYIYLRTNKLLKIEKASAIPSTGDLILVANDKNTMVESLRSGIGDSTPTNGYLIKSTTDNARNILVVAGANSVETLYAAYRFAHLLGCRFYLHGDVIPDTKTSLDITTFDEKSEPLSGISLRGIQPFHNFPQGPDWWNLGDYKNYIAQLPKMGMNFIGLHQYPLQPGDEAEGNIGIENGPEPHVWIGKKEDVNSDGTVKAAYPAFLNHTQHEYFFTPITNTSSYHKGASLLFENEAFGNELMTKTPDKKDNVKLFNNMGAFWKDAFGYAKKLGVKTALGVETFQSQPYAQTIPDEMLKRYGWAKGSTDNITSNANIKLLYEGMFDRITKTHHLDYFWIWTCELWYAQMGTEKAAVDRIKKEFKDAYDLTQSMKTPFKLATLGWQHGVAGKPAEFDGAVPKNVPFGSLWGEATVNDENRLDKLSKDRVKWAFTWLEEDWGLIQPQAEVNRVFDDLLGATKTPNCQAFLTKFWRTTILAPQVNAMGDLLWCRGKTGSTIN